MFYLQVYKPIVNSDSFIRSLGFLFNKYSYQDAFFIYRDQIIFLSKLGNLYLNNPNNWDALNVLYIQLFFVNETNLSNSQFFYSSKFYPNLPIYFNAFNFLTNGVIFTSNSASLRTSNNSWTRVYAIGKKIVSYLFESISAEPYSNPIPVALSNGTETKTKIEPNGQPIFDPPSDIYYITYPNLFDQLIIYPLQILGNLLIQDSSIVNYFNNVDVLDVTFNFKYFLITLIRLVNLNNIDRKILTFLSPVLIDTIFAAQKPIVGNNSLYNTNTYNQPYNVITLGDCEKGSVTNGIPSSIGNDYYYYFSRDELDSSMAFHAVFDMSNQPDIIWSFTGGIWINNPIKEPQIYYGNNYLVWHNPFIVWGIPATSVDVITMYYPNTGLETKEPTIFSNNIDSTVNNLLGMANSLSPSNTTNAIVNYVSFDYIGETFNRNQYTNDVLPFDTTTAQNNLYDGIIKKYVFDDNNYKRLFMDKNPFNVGMRYFDHAINMNSYYQLKHFYTLSVGFSIPLPVPIIPVENLFSLGIFKIDSVLAQYREASLFVIPPKTIMNQTYTSGLMYYLTNTRRNRAKQLPSFITNSFNTYMKWREITSANFVTFEILVNDLTIINSNNTLLNVFLLFR